MSDRSHLPELDALRLLVEVARTGSIGAAARVCGMTQQSASQRVRSVEAQVGVTLVQRGARGSMMTPAGVVLVEWATRLDELADEVAGAIETLRERRDRGLRIAASMTVAEHLLPGWLVLLRRRQTAEGRTPTSVSLTATNSAQVVESVLAGSADLGFVEGPEPPTTVQSSEVGVDALALVAAPDDPLARRRRPLTPADVAALALTSREPGSGTRQVVEDAVARAGLVPAAPAVELTTSTAIRESVRAGGPPAFLSRHAVDQDLGSGRLVELRTTGLDLVRTLRAIWTGSATPPAGPARELLAVARARQPG